MIEIHNTLTGHKEVFQPVDGKTIRMYVCGITPYDACHLGHARCYVVFDIVRRVLKAQGYAVRMVQNFTDVDDKIIARAKERGISPKALAQEFIDDYFSKMDALGVQRADVYPRVTDHIPDIIAFIRKLVDKKIAYPLHGDIYFSARQFAGYGKLSKRSLDELQSGARIDIDREKKDPLDFALWKASKPGDPPEVCWESPWGSGRPGWHIECSVMSLKHLGTDFDIHGGGLDLIFPHHENEIAQSEAATGMPFARMWIHNGFVTVNREKMSKSLGNFFALSDIFAKYHPGVVRYMLLGTHYRSPLNFSESLLDQSRNSRSSLKAMIARVNLLVRKQSHHMDQAAAVDPQIRGTVEDEVRAFQDALTDDFNTPEALAVVHRLANLLEKEFSSNEIRMASIRFILDHLQKMADMLGLDIFSFTDELFYPPEVTDLCNRREEARKRKDWKEADRLRGLISERGYVVEDTATGPRLLPKATHS